MPDPKICQIDFKNLDDISDRKPGWMSERNVCRISDRLQIELHIMCIMPNRVSSSQKTELVGITQIHFFQRECTELGKVDIWD